MSKEVQFFLSEEVDPETKFYRYLDTLVSHKSGSKTECILFIIIYYTQLVSGFFGEQVGILNSDETPDNYFMLIQRVIRIRDLFKSSYEVYCILLYIFFILMVGFSILFIYRMKSTGRTVSYSISEIMLNFAIKCFIYILYQPILDFCLSLLCFGNQNPNFDEEITCSPSNNIALFIIMFFTLIFTIFLGIFFSRYYNENFLLSNSPISRITTNYELYLNINSAVFTIILNFTYSIGSIVFILYNTIMSLVLLNYFLNTRPFYDTTISYLIGFFHMLYAWTALFCLLFYFIGGHQVSIVYISILLILMWMYYNMHQKMNDAITLEKPFYKLNDKFSILIYIRYIISKYKTLETNPEDKAKIIGIIHLHKKECPMVECPSKLDRKKFYLPITDQWSNPNKMEFNDRVYLYNFIIFIYDYFISQNFYDNDILINLSMYYLQTIGNHCRSMFYHQKAGDNQMNTQEKFMHFRASELISKALLKSCRPSNEIAANLEDINFSQYFKYHNLAEKFKVNLIKDVNLSNEFWHLFITKNRRRKKLDFNQIFELTDKIRITKQTIDKLWEDIFQTYNGCNELFDLYENYVESINDDSLTLRELLKIRNKNFALEGIANYYNTLFNNDTCIIVCNGDKGKEGIIEKVSPNITRFFGYKEEEVKGINIGALMPKMFEKDHKSFMQRYFRIGKKRIVDKTLRTYGKDKNNALIVLNLSVKLLPILGEKTFYCAMMTREDIEDVILLDSEYNIQAMSCKLYNLFKLNSIIFQEVDVPFWMICKEFIRHYQTFMMNNSRVNPNSNNEKNSQNKKKEPLKVGSTIIKVPKNEKESNSTVRSKNSDDTNLENINIQNTELDFEINENADVEWEIIIPPLFKTYVSGSTKTKKKNYPQSTLAAQTSSTTNEKYMMADYTDDEETNNLLPKNDNNNKVGDSNTNTNNDIGDSEASKSVTQTYAGNSQDKSFQNAIAKYRAYFSSNNKSNFSELMQILDRMNERTDQVFKFIISFFQIKYSDKKTGYVIRCIDNKESNDTEDSENNRNENNAKIAEEDKKQEGVSTKKEIFDRSKYLKEMTEIVNKTETEILKMKLNIDELHKLVDENIILRNLVDDCQREILKYSRVLGKNFVNVYDENGSQSSSQTGYTNSITKKTRVQEIKSHIMGNVDKFYTLILIKILFLIFMICTLIIGIMYLINFSSLIKSVDQVNTLHSNVLKLGFNFISFLSYVNSYVALSLIRNVHNDTFYNVYTSGDIKINETNYNELYDNYISIQDNSIIELEQTLEYLSHNVMFDFSDIISNFQQREYYFQFIPYYKGQDADKGGEISFPLSIELYITVLYRLTITEKYEFPYQYPNEETKKVLEYLSFLGLDNPYLTVIPYLLSLINNNTWVCAEENNSNVFNVNLIAIIFVVITAIFAAFYAFFLFLTSKTMDEGMLKISKIDPTLIADTIKTIDTFNRNVLSKYLEFSGDNGMQKHQIKKVGSIISLNKTLNNAGSITSINSEVNNDEDDEDHKRKKKKKKRGKTNNNENISEMNNSINTNGNMNNSANNTVGNNNQQKNNNANNNNIKKENNENNKVKTTNKKKNEEEEEGLAYYDAKMHKKLKVLSGSYIQSFCLVIIFGIFVIIIFIKTSDFSQNINDLLYTKDYFAYEPISSELKILNMKLKMSQRDISEDGYYSLNNYAKNYTTKIFDQISKHKALNDFYEKEYIANVCNALFDENSDNFKNCKVDKKIGEFSNVEEVLNMINNELYKIEQDYSFKKKINSSFNSFVEFNSDSYSLLDYMNNIYLNKMIDVYCNVIEESNNDYVESIKNSIRTIIIFMILILWIFCIYVIFFYIQNLVHLLLISRCIFKIIPTRVINQTKELEDWMDDKY